MNLILSLCLFSLLLFSSCLTANIERNASSSDSQQLNGSGSGLEVDASNEDFFYPIFDVADLKDLIKLAKAPRIAEFVKNHIFPAKYRDLTFYYTPEENDDVFTGKHSVSISVLDLFIDVLTHFGGHIKKISIAYLRRINDKDEAKLIESISEHCSTSTKTLALAYIKKNTFTHFTKPLLKVNRLEFLVETNQIGSEYPFDKIFPNLDDLYINYWRPGSNRRNETQQHIDIEYPVMEHLKSFMIYNSFRGKNEPEEIKEELEAMQKQIGNFFRKNPQIPKIWYADELDDFIHKINEYLPHLEHFTVHKIMPNIRPVHFKNVKYFAMTLTGYYWHQPCPAISFDRLESVNLTYWESERSSWMAFLRNHQTIRQVKFEAGEEEGLMEFVAVVPNLHDITIISEQKFNLNIVSGLIESHNNLTRLHYDAKPRNESIPLNMDSFHAKYGNEWNINFVSNHFDNEKYERRNYIDLEKK